MVYVDNVFDDDGRLHALCGPDGDPTTLEGCSVFDRDVAAGVTTLVDAAGDRRDRVLDEHGNVLIERQWIDAETWVAEVEIAELRDEGEVEPAAERLLVEYEGKAGRDAAQVGLVRGQGASQPPQVVRVAGIDDIEVLGETGGSVSGRRCAPHDDEAHAGLGERPEDASEVDQRPCALRPAARSSPAKR